MAKVKISQYDATAGNNTDIDSISIAEGMLPSNVNNALRELMAHLKDMDAGTQALTSPQLTSVDINGGTIDGAVIGGNSAAAITGTAITGTSFVSTGDMTFADNDKAIFGAGSDLQIWHDSSDAQSYIADLGTGNLNITSNGTGVNINKGETENMATFAIDGAVTLFHNNAAKLATTNTGVAITGGFTANAASTIIAADGAADNGFVLTIKNQEATNDRSFGLRIEAGSNATDLPLNIETHDGGTALFQLAGSGQARFVDGTAALPSISNLNGPDLNTGMFFRGEDQIGFSAGGTEFVAMGSFGVALDKMTNKSSGATITIDAPVTFNETSTDRDFRVESDGNANMLFVDGGNNRVGIGRSAPPHCLSVSEGANGIIASFTNQTNADFQINLTSGVSLLTPSTGVLALGTSNTERMRVHSTGQIAIGTTAAPTTNSMLLIQGDGGTDNMPFIEFQNTATGNDENLGGFIAMIGTDSVGQVSFKRESSTSSGYYQVFTQPTGGSLTERFRINAAGSSLFNCTSFPSASVAGFGITGSSSGNCSSSGSSTGGYNHFLFRNGNNIVGSISTSGSATSYTTSSDYRLKENVDYDWDATTRLKKLKPARFNFIADADTTVDGFLAHEAQAVVPEAVYGTHNEVDDDGAAVMQSIDQSKLVPLLVKTILELEARITALEG